MVFYSDSVDTETSMRNVSGTIALYRYLKLLQNKKYLIISAIIIRSLAKLIKESRGGQWPQGDYDEYGIPVPEPPEIGHTQMSARLFNVR